ncbi:hypothetical protein I553_5320 [Mycobacterium xenopi 4042]|uniref:Uncharacterized protein n=1 Tax=Mycobacterium xenopi 4042 TaxID=1299334 RepID=X7ZVD9_MYCXE|nr:hypothetical protein I553_5320 [Mycobacterium xenopi 4042]
MDIVGAAAGAGSSGGAGANGTPLAAIDTRAATARRDCRGAPTA